MPLIDDPILQGYLLEAGLKIAEPDVAAQKRADLEALGWKDWLLTLFPFWFSENFSEEHIQYWSLHWDALHKIKLGEEVPNKELVKLLLLGRGLGKCLSGDTDISMADGTRKKMRDLAAGDTVLSYNEITGKFEADNIRSKWSSGIKHCIRITSRSKKTLTLTPEHKILTFDGWKTASELVLGDRIASPRHTPVFEDQPDHLDEEVRLLAYFLAEGCTAGKGAGMKCTITNADDPIVDDVIHCAQTLGFKAKRSTGYNVHISGGSRPWVRLMGMENKKAIHKRIPEWVFRIPNRQKWQFISAFIDTDGWIGQNGKIGITLANQELILDLQNLLLQVGIISCIQFRKNAYANAWELLFDQEGVNTHHKSIQLLAKQGTYDKHLETERYSLVDTYPYQAMRTLPYGVGYAIQQAGLSISHTYDVTRKKMRRAIEIYPHPEWQRLESLDIFWDKIIKIEGAGECETFDAEVEHNHNFITNNLISHNSSVLEGARIMRGALLGGGYSLIISETDDQAQEHLGNCRILIEHPESKLLEYYPDMAIAEQSDVLKGMPTADRKEMFICRNGYICRAKGLSAKMRGLRVGIHRPDDIAFDDIDDVNDSLAVSGNKLRLITASILPVQARKNVTVDVGQNLISEHSVVNQIFSGKTDALADRTVIGVAKAFVNLDMESKIDETGKLRHTILETSTPSWSGFSVVRAQKFLDNSGLATFMAEYQNEFNQFNSGKVVPEYNEKAQVITWSQFEQIFGERRIPSHWNVIAGLDVGYSEGQYPHYSVWSFLATAAMNSPLPHSVFIYRGRSFKGVSIDDQAETILSEMYEDEMRMVKSWQMSHERTGELMTLWQKYKIPFSKFRYYKAEDGVAQWRHMSRCDHSKPNPFKPDFKSDNGLYTIGRPTLFYIVDDVQILQSFDDNGLHVLREQVANWEYVPVKLTETGQTIQKPSKVNDDFCDCIKSCLAWFGASATELTKQEKIMDAMPEQFKKEDLTEREKVAQNLWLQRKALEEKNKQMVVNPFNNLGRGNPLNKLNRL